jgi:hypothetical protein
MTSPREIRITVTGKELTYLRATGFITEKLSEQLMLVESVGLSKYIIDMSKADAEALHSALLDQLVRVGFDDDYVLNQDGEVLEELIDRIFSALQS